MSKFSAISARVNSLAHRHRTRASSQRGTCVPRRSEVCGDRIIIDIIKIDVTCDTSGVLLINNQNSDEIYIRRAEYYFVYIFRMRLLELFCGTKSVGRVAEELGWEVVSVDIEKKFCPTHLCDVLDFDETAYPRDHFDMVWASPPCTEFSRAKTVGERDIFGASKIVQRAREIIQYYDARHWVIENPVGLLRDQALMADLAQYRKTVSYCKYGFSYRKNTDLWTNIQFQPKVCDAGTYCHAKKTRGKHDVSMQHDVKSIRKRYSLPSALIEDLLSIPAIERLTDDDIAELREESAEALRRVDLAIARRRAKRLIEERESGAPYVCPLTRRMMEHPVTAPDGHTYERSAIVTHIADSNTFRSPLTHVKFATTSFMLNVSLKNQIDKKINEMATREVEGESLKRCR